MDMGLTKGTEVYIRKVAPLGDPVEITVSLRKLLSCLQLQIYINIFIYFDFSDFFYVFA